MTITKDPLAIWHFNYKNTCLYNHEEVKLNHFEFPCLNILGVIIDIFQNDNLLHIKQVKFLRGENYGGSTIIMMETPSKYELINRIIQERRIKESSDYLIFNGYTILKNLNLEERIDHIIELIYDFKNCSLMVNIFSDSWLPIDRDGNYQVQLAEDNASRLEQVLKKVKQIGYDDILPDEENEFEDALFPQKGFKIYMQKPYFYDNDSLNLPIETDEIIRKYFWENRS